MNGLDLFSGIGGLSLALSPWVRTIAYCENDRYAQAVLLSRMQTRELEVAPIWDDVRTIKGEMLPPIDIIYGGFPCQDISVAGNSRGLGGERSILFYEVLRLSKEIKPTFLFLENVPGIRTRGLDRIVWELSELGYDCRWDIVSAAEVGAPHIRDRWFLLAHSNGKSVRIESGRGCGPSRKEKALTKHDRKTVAHAARFRWNQGDKDAGGLSTNARAHWAKKRTRPANDGWWDIEPDVGRVANGVPFRVDRLRGLGNAVVPAQAREAFIRLSGVTND